MSSSTALEASAAEFHRSVTELQMAFQGERECLMNDGVVAAEAFIHEHPEYDRDQVYRLALEKVQEEIGKLRGRLLWRITDERRKLEERNRRLRG